MNLLQQFIDSPLAEKLGWCLLHSLWQITLIGLIFKVTLDLIGHRSATLRYNLGLVALLAAVVLPVSTWLLIETPIRTQPTARSVLDPMNPMATVQSNDELDPVYLLDNAGKSSIPLAATWQDSANPFDQNALETSSTTNAIESYSNPKPKSITPSTEASSPWISWMACGWLIGIVIFALRPLIGIRSADRLRRFTRRPVPHSVLKTLERLKGQLGIHRAIQVSHSRLIDVPTLVGLLRPVILLPFSSVTSLSALELDAILLHELAHVRRNDQLVNLIQTVIETLLFFHPVVWWMSANVRLERENCCDDLAVGLCGESKSLAKALMTLEEKRNSNFGLATMSADGGSLLSRIKRLTDPNYRSGRSSVSLLSATAALLVVVSLAATLAISSVTAAQPLVKGPDNLSKLNVTSVSDLYQWESLSTDDPRLLHRFWNIFSPENREQQGEMIEEWKPDLEFDFLLGGREGEEISNVRVQVGLQDGFCWSVGNGVWLMDSQWPMRYSMAKLIRDSRADGKEAGQAEDESAITLREKLFNNNTYHREKESLTKNHHGKWVAIVDGRVLASFDTFDACLSAADQANRHASHRYIFRPGIDDQPQEFAHSPWITGQPNWWQLGIQFRRDNLITTAMDRWIVDQKTLRTDANGKGMLKLMAPGDPATNVTHTAVCSGMVTQQLTMISNDVKRLKLNRFAVPGTARCLTYNVDCQKVNVVVSIEQLGIRQPVVAFVVPQAIVNLDPPVAAKSPTIQIDLNPDHSLPGDIDKLRQMREEARVQLEEVRKEWDTIDVLRQGETCITLHQVKILELDSELRKLRKELRTLRENRKFLDAGGEEDAEVLVWVLEQENLIKKSDAPSASDEQIQQQIVQLELEKTEKSQSLGPDHQTMKTIDRKIDALQGLLGKADLSSEELIRRYRLKLDLEIETLEDNVLQHTAQYKFHYEKARRLDENAAKQKMLRQKIAAIGVRINELELSDITSESERQKTIKARYRRALDEYKTLHDQRKNAAKTPISSNGISLHTNKIRELDSELSKVRRELAMARADLKTIEMAVGNGSESAESVLWIMEQEGKISYPKDNENRLAPSEIIRRFQIKLKRQIKMLDVDIQQLTEQYKFYYQKAKAVQVLNERLRKKREEIDLIEPYLDEATRTLLRFEAGVELPTEKANSDQEPKVEPKPKIDDKVELERLDKELRFWPKNLATQRAEQIWIQNAIDGGVSQQEVLVWLLQQEGIIRENQTADIQNQMLETIRENIANLVKQREALSKTLGQAHPDMTALDTRIDRWKKFLAAGQQAADGGSDVLPDAEIIRRFQIKTDRSVKILDLKVRRLSKQYKTLYKKLNPDKTSAVARDHPTAEANLETNWLVRGTVKDETGKPLAGVRVWANTGMGSLRRTGEAITDDDGKYEMTFGPGMVFAGDDDNVRVQAATIFASKEGYAEQNLCRQGDRLMAIKMPTTETAWGSQEQIAGKLILRGKPVTIDFVMQPAAKISGYLVDQDNNLLQKRSISISGPELPPSSSVLGQIYSDTRGHFEIGEIPLDKKWFWEVRPNSGERIEVKTDEFELDAATETKILLRVDLSSNPPTISSEPLTAEMEGMLSGKDMKQVRDRRPQYQVIRGQTPHSRDLRRLKWGEETDGLRAAIRFKDYGKINVGDRTELEFVVHNNGDQTIELESESWRQNDRFEIRSAGLHGTIQKAAGAMYTGRSILNTYRIEPGEVATFATGPMLIVDPNSGDDQNNPPTQIRATLKPGKYLLEFILNIPGFQLDNDHWKGQLKTGKADFEVLEKTP